MSGHSGPPKDYPDPLDEPDPFDPTGYYARKARKNAEMLPYLIAVWFAALLMVAVTFIWRYEMLTGLVIGFAAGLVVGWNVLPQPEWARNLYEKARAKIRG